MIEVLFEGVHTNHYHDGFYEIDPLTSSVTLIQHEGKNVLIDTGTPAFRSLLLEKLRRHGLEPIDIQYICNTHFHLDHCGNDAFFPNAQVFIGRSKLDYKTGKATVYGNVDNMEYPCTIQMVFTPGHTFDHAAYVYMYEGLRYVCAGDSVREDIIRSQKVPHVHLPDQFVPSMKKIFEMADVIIPGHGRVISGSLKNELYELVKGKWQYS